MRTAEERKERAQLRYDLVKLVTANAATDETYFKRLLWALETITNALADFEEGEKSND